MENGNSKNGMVYPNMGLEYLPTFTINIMNVGKYSSPMEHVGYKSTVKLQQKRPANRKSWLKSHVKTNPNLWFLGDVPLKIQICPKKRISPTWMSPEVSKRLVRGLYPQYTPVISRL